MAKKRISLTIDGEILRGLDRLVDDVHIRSRSEAVESIIRSHINGSKAAVIVGGGNPNALKLDGTLKPLYKINGKMIIEYNLEEIQRAGFNKAFFVGKSEVIGECFKAIGDGEKYGIEIIYIEEKKALGNAKTLLLAQKYVNSPFLLLPVDNYFKLDLVSLAKSHNTEMPLVTLAVQASRDYSTGLGFVEMQGNKIISYEEKPKSPKTFLTALFIGMYSPEIFSLIPKGDVRWVIQKDIFPKIISEKEINGWIITGTSINIESIEDISFIKLAISGKIQ